MCVRVRVCVCEGVCVCVCVCEGVCVCVSMVSMSFVCTNSLVTPHWKVLRCSNLLHSAPLQMLLPMASLFEEIYISAS